MLIDQADRQPQGVLVILYFLAFLADQEDPLFPFFLFYHLVQEGLGDQLVHVNRVGLVDLEVLHDLMKLTRAQFYKVTRTEVRSSFVWVTWSIKKIYHLKIILTIHANYSFLTCSRCQILLIDNKFILDWKLISIYHVK